MDLKLFDTKLIFMSSSISQKGLFSGTVSSSRYMAAGVKVSPLLCSCKGTSLDVTCLSTSQSGISSVAQKKFGVDTYSYQFNANGVNPSIYFRERRVLEAFDDEYGGVIVNSERLPYNPNVFASILRSSLSHWRVKGKKGIWLKLPVEKCDLVPVAVKEGFQYHHAERGYIMLTYWIPDGPCMLPANASHQVGVGGFVLNDKNEVYACLHPQSGNENAYSYSIRPIIKVLVVQEKHCSAEFDGLWKLPTGFILESEEIFNGAVREVKEETGVDTEFMEVIAFRHAHNVAFEKSDLFFICMLKPVSFDIKADDLEVQAAKWMPLEEFVEQPLIQGDSMFKKIIDICIARLGKRYCGLSVHKVVSKFDDRLSSLYYNVVEDQEFCRGI